MINEQKDLETRFGEQRRERDFVEADVAKKRLNLTRNAMESPTFKGRSKKHEGRNANGNYSM